MNKKIKIAPHTYFLKKDLASAYREMARDEAREKEAEEWVEMTSKDISDEPGAGYPFDIKC